jgi:hypothetical protein
MEQSSVLQEFPAEFAPELPESARGRGTWKSTRRAAESADIPRADQTAGFGLIHAEEQPG